MKLYPIITLKLLVLVMALISCQPEVKHISNSSEQEDSISQQETEIESSQDSIPTKGQTAYILVNNLRLRQHHDLKSKVIAMLKEGEEVVYLGETSENKEEIELRGEKKVAPFYKVKTQKGNIGWAYGGALSFKTIAPKIEGYRAVIAFVKDGEKVKPEAMADWSYYSSEALDMARKSGILTSFADEDFDKVLIKDKSSKVLDEVNILRYAKEHRWGLVCVEKGKKPHFIPFSPKMGNQLADFFQLSMAEKVE